jgi:hypothetical protein
VRTVVKRARSYLALALVLIAGCSGSSSSTSVAPITPTEASISATTTFDAFHNQLGDPLEALNVHIQTNIPVPFRVQVQLDTPSGSGFLFNKGDNYNKCLPDGCYVRQGRSLGADWWCSNTCPAGVYKVTLIICSYAENQEGLLSLGIRCNHQEREYLDWVGHFGTKLTGNSLASPDPDHHAILNLRSELSFAREGKAASPSAAVRAALGQAFVDASSTPLPRAP